MNRIFLAFFVVFMTSVGQASFQIRNELGNSYCKISSGGEKYIQIKTNTGANLTLTVVPGQKPDQPEDGVPTILQNNFTHAISMSDLSLGKIKEGEVAFNTRHVSGSVLFVPNNAVIFTEQNPKGISKETYVRNLPESDKKLAAEALETFLKLFPIFSAALDSCRPIKVMSYSTSEDLERVEHGRMQFYLLTKHFNSGKLVPRKIDSRGIKEGFYDPSSRDQIYDVETDFEYLNPLNFDIKPGTPKARGELPEEICSHLIGQALKENPYSERIRKFEFLFTKTKARCQNFLSKMKIE